MLMEQAQHTESAFVTLTYKNAPMVFRPEDETWIPTLVKSDLQNWLRSVRKKSTRLGVVFRYFAAAEYGDEGGRPHYHVITFGTGPFWTSIYEDSWNKGFVSSYEATPSSMAYVAKYCLKGGRDPELDDHPTTRISLPPFRLMSRNPAIGKTFAPNIANTLAGRDGHGSSYDPTRSGPANQVRIHGKRYPLDRTMRQYVGTELLQKGINPYMADAMLNRDYPDATQDEIKKGREAHTKALRQRNARNKL